MILDQRKNNLKDAWLIDASDLKSLHGIKNELNTLPIDLDDDFLILRNDTKNVSLMDAYKIAEDDEIIFIKIGIWEQDNKSFQWSKEAKWTRRRDLRVILERSRVYYYVD